MAATLKVKDETTTGESFGSMTLEFLTEHITVRELIRERVYQEVKDYNADGGETFRGLVQPTGAEQGLDGYRMKQPRHVEWEPQFDKACEAFEANQVLVLVDDRQTESLDDPITIGPRTEVTFLKLVPLVGG